MTDQETSPRLLENAASDSDSFALQVKAIVRVVIRRRWPIMITSAVVIVAAIFLTLRQQKIYGANCTLLIDLAAPKVLDNQQVQEVVDQGPGSFWYTREYYETQYKVIASRAVAARVVEKLHLGEDARFLGLDKVEDAAQREKLRPTIDAVSRAQVLLRVEPVKESRIVQLKIEYPDPKVAAEMANAFAEAYIAETLSVRQSTTLTASEWLENQLVDLEAKLDKSMQALYAFKKEKDIVSTSFEDKQSMVSQRLVALNEALTRTRIQRAQLEARSETLKAILDGARDTSASDDAVAQLSNQTVVQQMKLRVVDLANECGEVRARYLEQHPKFASCMERLAVAKANLKREIDSGLGELQRQFQEVARTERNLIALFGDARNEAFKVNQNEEEYQHLKRALDNNQRLYDLVLKRLKDAGLAGLMRMSNVRIIDRARSSEVPVKPNIRLNLLISLILALVASALVVLVVEKLDSTLKSQQQIEERLGLTFLGIVPKVVGAKEETSPAFAIHMQPKSAMAECCRSIRTNLLFMSPDKPPRSMLITSSRPRDGKTTTAASLAVSMADSGNRVLLIDADMRRPSIHRLFKLPNEVGLSSLVVGSCSLEDTIKSTDFSRLSALVCGPMPPNPSELLHTKTFASLLRTLEEKFDFIVIDSPPVGIVADPAIISTLVDGTLLVVKAGYTSSDQAKHSIATLSRVKAKLFGVILNDLDIESREYDYYYYKQYGYYYASHKDEALS